MTIKHTNIKIDELLNGFLIGSKLGDGSFIQRTPSHNTYIVFSHCKNQLGYLNWKFDILKEYNLINRNQHIKQLNPNTRSAYPNAQDQYKFATKSTEVLNKYNNTEKVELIKEINELGLCVYILDDGNIYKKACKISCGSFSNDERNEFIKILNDRFNITAHVYKHYNNKSKDYFYIPATEYEKIKTIIFNNIPNNIDIVVSKFNMTDDETKTIQIKYFNKDITHIDYMDNSDWIDLRAAETVELKAGEFKLIPLGVGMILPKGYEAHVVPRSSTYKTFGIIQTNHMGVIDNSYCGNNDQWMMPVYATRDTVINMNDRICQFRIVKNQPKLKFKVVDILSNKDRNGFGSTGK